MIDLLHPLAPREVERQEASSRITGTLGGEIVLNIAARIEMHEPALRQRHIDQECHHQIIFDQYGKSWE